MSRGLNKVMIIGTLGKDPDVRYSGSGSAVVNVSVATNESWKDKQTGEKMEKTEWHRIVMFGKLGEIAGQYLTKGSLAYFEGKIQTRKWKDNEGQDRYSTEIVANQMQMLGGKPQAVDNHHPEKGHGHAPEPAQQEKAAPADDGFDDIPF